MALVMLLLVPAAARAVDEFPLPNQCPPVPAPDVGTCQPAGITTGPDGAIWFTQEAGNRIMRMTTAGAVTLEVTLPAGSLPTEIVTGPDGRLWFTQSGRTKIGTITTGGAFQEYPTSGSLDAPADGITVGPDSNIWFTEFSAGGTSRVGRMSTAGSLLNEFPLPNGSEPGDITSGPDGNVWFTEAAVNRIARITTGGTVTELTIPTAGSDPSGITTSGAAIWFTEHAGNKIGRIDPFAGAFGAITNEFPAGAGEPSGITTGADGALWYTETGPNRIGRMTTTGVVTNEFAIPTPGSQPGTIRPGPDGALWFTEFVGNNIGRIATAPPAPPPPPPPPPVAAAPTAKKCKVPKLRRLTVKKAKRRLKKAGCKYRIRGKRSKRARVHSTKPKAGRTTTKRVIVKLKAKRAKRKRRR